MNLVLKLKDISKTNIFFADAVKNTVMSNSDFVRINYSNALIMTNGIHLNFELVSIYIDKYYAKYRCTFNLKENFSMVYKLYELENDILSSYMSYFDKDMCYKINYKLKEQLSNGCIKILNSGQYNNNNNNNNINLILKISGVWDTGHEIGLTYKFLYN